MTVSIIIPVYNRKELLRETIDSVLAQTYADFECIISDNCSTDGAFELAKEYAARDPRIRLFQNQKNVGPVLNWLIAVEKAQYPWIKILFSDDILHPECIAKSMEAVAQSSSPIGAVYFAFRSNSLRWKMDGLYNPSAFLVSYILPGNRVSCSPSAYLLRKEGVLQALNLNLSSYSDLRTTGVGYDIATIVLSVAEMKVNCIRNQLVYFRDSPSTMTRLAAKDQPPFFLSIKYHYVLMEIIDGCPFMSRRKSLFLKSLTAITILYYRFRSIMASKLFLVSP
jgi:glycosyltransferase involved in cell wall biosynthesis